MGFIVDLIIIAIVLLSTFLAYRKGVIKLAIGLCTFVIAIVVTLVLYMPISNLVINITAIDEAIENSIYEKANETIKETDNELANQVIEAAKEKMLPETARSLAINIIRGAVIIILFIGTKIALKLISAVADAIAKLPIIKQINQAGGIIYGLIRGILVVYVILLILTIPGQISPKNPVNDNINKSSLGKVMYENNLLKVFF